MNGVCCGPEKIGPLRSWLMSVKRRVLPDAAAGRLHVAFGVTEPTAGSDTPSITTFARRDGDNFTIRGQKVWTSKAKESSKVYQRHSGHPQGFKEESLGKLLERRPEEVVRRAIKGMLPHTRLGAQQLRKLKIYAGSDHPHQAQRPEPLA